MWEDSTLEDMWKKWSGAHYVIDASRLCSIVCWGGMADVVVEGMYIEEVMPGEKHFPGSCGSVIRSLICIDHKDDGLVVLVTLVDSTAQIEKDLIPGGDTSGDGSEGSPLLRECRVWAHRIDG